MSDVVLPVELASGKIPLDTIGAIFVLYSINKLEKESLNFWNVDKIFQNKIDELKGDGIIRFVDRGFVDHGNGLSIDIDLSKLKLDFWDIEYDDQDNKIYTHPSHYGDEDGAYKYILKPYLFKDKIYYNLIHSEWGLLEKYISSVEEGENIVRLELGAELERIKNEQAE